MKMPHLLSVCTLALASLLACPANPSYAAAAQVKTAAPGFYRTMLGDFEITVLSDGTVQLPVDKLLTNTSSEKTRQALQQYHLHSPLETSVNGYLINTGNKLVLIDAGAGSLFGPTLGKLRSNLQAAGYTPEQIDEIYITHMHADHVGGLMDGAKMAFPNALVRADRHDADYWLSQANMDQAPTDMKGFFQGAMASINPYIQAGHFKTFEGSTELLPGIRAVPAYGHTAGHSIYRIESRGQTLVLWGDLIHVAAVQFEHPAVTIQFDSDSKAAAKARLAAFTHAAQAGTLIGAAHLSFPGLGYLRKAATGYAWMPLNYVPTSP